MLVKLLRSKGFWAFVLPLAIVGFAQAGGEGCRYKSDAAKAAKADGKTGAHCLLVRGIEKQAKVTDDGAVVTLTGKNDKAVGHIKSHLTAHTEGEGCEHCPLSMDGVNAKFDMKDNGGTITVTASNPEAIKAVHEWANKPAGACCGKDKAKKA